MQHAEVLRLFELYWELKENSNVKEYSYAVTKLLKDFDILNSGRLKKIFEDHQLGKPIGACSYCKKEFFVYSRSAWKEFSGIYPCQHTGLCKECNYVPVSREDYCRHCETNIEEKINQARQAVEEMVEIDDLNSTELQALAYINENEDALFINGMFSENKISFALRCPISEAYKIIYSLGEKGAIILRKENKIWSYCGVSNNLDIPKFHREVSLQIIPSPLAQQAYFKLKQFFPHVFPEAVFSSFVNFDDISLQILPEERSGFFSKRLDFICCNENFEAIAAVEYNGKHHFSNSSTQATRKFKKKMCQLIGIPLLEVNSAQQIDWKIDELAHILNQTQINSSSEDGCFSENDE